MASSSSVPPKSQAATVNAILDNQVVLVVFILATVILARSMVKDAIRMATTGRRKEALVLLVPLVAAFAWLVYLLRFVLANQ
jgi:hypothetical protein